MHAFTSRLRSAPGLKATALAATLLLAQMNAQFTARTVQMAPPNSALPTAVSGFAQGTAVGTFTLTGVPEAYSYNLATSLFELDLDSPNQNLFASARETPTGTDGTRAVGYENFQSTYILALGTHTHCLYWDESTAHAKQVQHPSQYGDSWCAAVDKGNSVGTAYLKYTTIVAIGEQAAMPVDHFYQQASYNGAPIVTNDFFCYKPITYPDGATCFSRARGIRGDDIVGDWSGVVGSPLDATPLANPFSAAVVWHPSTNTAVKLNQGPFFFTSALATNGTQKGGWGADAGGHMHAALWNSDTDAAIDLTPAGYQEARVSAMASDFQAGDAWTGPPNIAGSTHHGLVWRGSSSDFLDLNQFLPAGYPHLTITGADPDGNVVGYMQQDFNGAPAINTQIGVIFTPVVSTAISAISVSSQTPAPGDIVSGTIGLGAPAGVGGLTVGLTSSNNALVQPPASVLVPEGAMSASFPIAIVATTFAPAPTAVTISAHSGYTSRSTNITVTPKSPVAPLVALSISPANIAPGDRPTVQILLSGPAPAGGVIVNFLSSNPAVIPTPPSVIVPAGQSQASLTIGSSPANLFLPASVVLQASTGTVVQQATMTVTSPTVPLSVFLGDPQNESLSVSGAGSGQGIVGLSAVPQSPITLYLSSTNPALSVPPSVVVPAGSFYAGFSYHAVAVSAATSGVLTATVNGASASSTITATASPSPTIQSFVVPLVSATQTWSSGDTLTGTINLSSPAFLGGMQAVLTSSSPAVTVPASVTIASDSSSVSFSITAGLVTSPTSVTIGAALPGFAAVPVTLAVIPGPALTLSGPTMSPYSMIGPGVSTTGTVSLNQPAPAGGVLVTLTATPASAKIPTTVSITQGQTSGSFAIQANSVSAATAVTIGASYKGLLAPLGTSASGSVVISPGDTLKMPKPTWSSSTHLLSVTATGSNPQAVIAVLNAAGDAPLGTMTSQGNGNFTFQSIVSSIASVNLRSSLGGATGQGVSIVP